MAPRVEVFNPHHPHHSHPQNPHHHQFPQGQGDVMGGYDDDPILFKDSPQNLSDTETDSLTDHAEGIEKIGSSQVGSSPDSPGGNEDGGGGDNCVTKPGPHDVLLGRGGGTNNHTGNVKFRKLVNEHKMRYLASSKVDKPKVAREVVQLWRKLTPPGRFLARKDDSKRGPGSVKAADNVWYEVGDKKAREKASQCLRERTPEVLPYIQHLREQQNAMTEQGVSLVQQQLKMQQAQERGGGGLGGAKSMKMNDPAYQVSPRGGHGGAVFPTSRNTNPMVSDPRHPQQQQMSPHAHRQHLMATAGAEHSPMGRPGGGMMHMTGRRTSMPAMQHGPPAPSAFSRRTSLPCAPQLGGMPPNAANGYRQRPQMPHQQQQQQRHAAQARFDVPEEDYYVDATADTADMTEAEYQHHMMMLQQQLHMQQIQLQRLQQQRAMQRAHAAAVASTANAMNGGAGGAFHPQQHLAGSNDGSSSHDDEPLPLDTPILGMPPMQQHHMGALGQQQQQPQGQQQLPYRPNAMQQRQQQQQQQQEKQGQRATRPAPAGGAPPGPDPGRGGGNLKGGTRPGGLKRTMEAVASDGGATTKDGGATESGADTKTPSPAPVRSGARGLPSSSSPKPASAGPANEDTGELTLEEYRQHLEEYINSNQIPQHSEIRLDDDEDDDASDLEDDWEKEKEKAYLQQQKQKAEKKRGVNRNVSGCSMMSAKTSKSGITLVSGMSGLSDLMSVGTNTRENRMSMARSVSSNISLMSELTDLSQNIDNISLYDD